MRNGVLTIMKKELARFFGDKRMVVSILMPGVLIYIMYAFMGNAMGSAFGMDEDYTPAIQAVSLPGSMEAAADGIFPDHRHGRGSGQRGGDQSGAGPAAGVPGGI